MSHHKIKITDDRHSHTVPVANNGRIQFIPVNEPTTVDDGILGSLNASSISFELVGEEGGSEGGVLPEPSSHEEPHPLDHDGDGKKGGSKPKAQRKPKAARKPRAKTSKE